MSTIRPVRTEEDYDWALAQVAPYFSNEPELGTPESDRFAILVDLICAYEARHYPMPEPDPSI
jgi:HTH-type transcriptional regulator / antitoxin HigA